MEDDPAVLALFNQIGQVLRSEGRVTAKECVRDDAHGPHVYGLAVSLLEHDLRCGVAKRARHGGEDFVLRVEHLGDTKIGEHKGGVRVLGEVEKVLGFEICPKSTYVAQTNIMPVLPL